MTSEDKGKGDTIMPQRWVRMYRILFGLLTLAAIAYQFSTNSERDIWNPVNFFSFFTIQSNLIAAAVLIIGALPSREIIPRAWSMIRGAATMYMVTTFVVYNLLLSGLEESLQTPSPWVNMVLHQILPLVMVLDILFRPIPARHLTMRNAMLWLVYPGAYLAYTLVRGPRVDWYPYPFLDPRESGGYVTVAIYCSVILLGLVAMISLVVTLVHRSQPESATSSAQL